MLYRICVILRVVGFANENEVLFIFDRFIENRLAVLQLLAAETVHILARRRDPDQKLVHIRHHGLFVYVVLVRRLVGVDFVQDDYVRVQPVRAFRVRCQCLDFYRACLLPVFLERS